MWAALQKSVGKRNEVFATRFLNGDPNMTGTSIKSILALALLVGVASQANADIWGHVAQQAADIKCATSSLRKEVDHYRGTRYYGQLIGATARLKGQANVVNSIARHSHCPKALKNAVRNLDRAFHDAEFLFDSVEHDAAYGDGYIRGNTAHVKRQLNRIGRCIDNLRNDLRTLHGVHRPVVHNVYRPPVHDVYRPPTPKRYHPVGYDIYRSGINRPYHGGYGYDRGFDRVYLPYGRSSGGFGFSIGGGSSRISFGF